MKCVLMHKRIEVAQIELDDASGFIKKIGTIYAPEHLPVGIKAKKGYIDRAGLNTWWADRSIPASRSGVREALDRLNVSDTRMLLIRCNGLSLSDQYWIRPDGSGLIWDEINYFDHPFSDDIGDVLFGQDIKENVLDFSSPDSTSDGNLKKRWKVLNGKRCLIKGGSNPFRQQPLNEVIASKIMERLAIPHVTYSVIWNQGVPYSVCEDFIDRDTELVTAWRIMQTEKKANDVSLYKHFLNCAARSGIPNVISFLDRMIVLDYLIANEDRHLNNFGAVRNAETLKWIGMAPVYDSGSSLGYDKVAAEIRTSENVICKPFKKHHDDQLKLVTDFSWIDFAALSDVRSVIRETLSEEGTKDYIDQARIDAIADSVERRIQYLQKMSMTARSDYADDIVNDVEKDMAERYSS